MEGHGAVASVTNRNGGRGSLEFLAKDPATAARFRHLLGADGMLEKLAARGYAIEAP